MAVSSRLPQGQGTDNSFQVNGVNGQQKARPTPATGLTLTWVRLVCRSSDRQLGLSTWLATQRPLRSLHSATVKAKSIGRRGKEGSELLVAPLSQLWGMKAMSTLWLKKIPGLLNNPELGGLGATC